MFKYQVYNNGTDGNLCTELLKASIYKCKNIEKEISKNNPKKPYIITNNVVPLIIF